jgi:hypothetical protein
MKESHMGDQPNERVQPPAPPVTGLPEAEVDQDTGVVTPDGTVDDDAPTGDVEEPGKSASEGILRKDVEREDVEERLDGLPETH